MQVAKRTRKMDIIYVLTPFTPCLVNLDRQGEMDGRPGSERGFGGSHLLLEDIIAAAKSGLTKIYILKGVTALYCPPMNAFRCTIFQVPTRRIVAVSLLLLLVNLQSPPILRLSPNMT